MFKNTRIKPAAKIVRVEQAPAVKKPQPLPSVLAMAKRKHIAISNTSSARSSPAVSNPRSSPATSPDLDPSSLQVPKRKRKHGRQPSPSDRPKFDDSEDDDDDASCDRPVPKKQNIQGRDTKRQLRSRKAFSEEDGGKFDMIHAAEIAATLRKPKTIAGQPIDDVIVELKYPSASQRERFDLYFGKDKIDSIQEIFDIATLVTNVYLTHKQAEDFQGSEKGKHLRELERAGNILRKDHSQKRREDFKQAVDNYNAAIERLIQDGALAKNLDTRHDLPLNMVQLMLRQVYDRTVSPDVDSLRKYDAGTDNIYGELLTPFVHQILEKTKVTSDQVFVDLGSGVGNVVLQAALEIGCESWGCEIVENSCKLAKAQHEEFKARCRLWGIETGKVHLEEGDFMHHIPILNAIKRADVILVNNEVFNPKTNDALCLLFLDCKAGCKIVSLKSFVSENQITSRNTNNPTNNLEVERHYYTASDVSWTANGGNYYIATKRS